jgi:acetyltransferase
VSDFYYPKELQAVVALPSGKPLRIRPIKPEDEARLTEMAARMDPEDLRLRFFVVTPGLSHELAAKLTCIDYARDMALIAEPMESEEIVGVARYAAGADKGEAEFAVMVRSDWKGHGVGWMLMEKLVDIARQRGIGRLTGLVLRGNINMLRFCRDLGFTIASNADDPQTVYASLTLR